MAGYQALGAQAFEISQTQREENALFSNRPRRCNDVHARCAADGFLVGNTLRRPQFSPLDVCPVHSSSLHFVTLCCGVCGIAAAWSANVRRTTDLYIVRSSRARACVVQDSISLRTGSFHKTDFEALHARDSLSRVHSLTRPSLGSAASLAGGP